MNSLNGKKILVTGGCGSIGSQLVDSLISYKPNVIRILDNNERALHRMQSEYMDQSDTLRFLLGDVRERDRVNMAMEDIDVVFHCAALKHVELNEYNPFETIQTNVRGTQNVIRAALEAGVESFVGISTDKASNPTSVMGATKLLAERLIIAANTYRGPRDISFNCVRFGNVLGSRGSVVPVFLDQIEDGGPITVTDPEMTRFLMTAEKAVELIFRAYEEMRRGEIYVLKMPAFRLEDLVDAVCDCFAPIYGQNPDDIEVKIVGRKPGERTHEKLISADEMIFAEEREDMFVLRPQIDLGYEDSDTTADVNSLNGEYTSADADFLSQVDIIEQIEATGLVSVPTSDSWEHQQ